MQVNGMEAAGGLCIHKHEADGVWAKTQNLSILAWFWACCVKWQHGKMMKGGGDCHGDLERGVGSEVVWEKQLVLLTW